MGLFDLFKPKITEKQFNQMQENVLHGIQQKLNSLTLYPNYTTHGNAERYCTTDDVYSIVKLIASTAAMIPFYAYKKEANGDLQDLEETHPLNELLNELFEGVGKFESLLIIYTTLFTQGEVILYKEIPVLGPNGGKLKHLHFLPPQNVNIKVTNDFPRKIIAYQYVDNGKVIFDNIEPSDIIHIKYFNPKIGVNGFELRGLSPLSVAAKRLTRMDSNLDVSTAQIQNGGVPGIVYEKTANDNVSEVVGQRKDNFYKYLKSSSNKGAPYFSAGELGYIELGLKLVDLDVANLGKIDFKKLCNIFGVSDILFNNDSASTESNVKEMMKRLYTNTILPNVIMVKDAFNRGLISDKKTCIKYDLSDVTELQDDMKAKADVFAALPIMIPNNIMEAFNYGKSTDPLMDKIYVKSGYTLLDDIGMPQDLTLTGDYEKPKP